MRIELWALEQFPMVERDDDLAQLVVDAAAALGNNLAHGDIVVVTGKLVSKAEGRQVELSSVVPSDRAEQLATLTDKDARLVELVLRESVAVIRARPGNLLVRHKLGYVSAMAGIDRSNVSGDDDTVLLLPEDPDASAASIAAALAARTGLRIGVVISDSHGRPFRVGNTGVALGVSGIPALEHLEGRPDLFGRPLTGASVVPIADLIASAALLVSGEADEGTPIVIVRGLRINERVGHGSAASMIRSAERDLFATPDRNYP